MQSIHHQAVENYRTHPSFHFTERPFEIESSLVEDFGRAYAELAHFGDALSEKALATLKTECFARLQQVFDVLAGQTSDAYESRFVEELREQCARILREEIAWHEKPKRQRFVDFRSGAALDDTLKLHTDHHYFARLRPQAVAELQAISKDSIEQLKANAAQGRLKREDLSVNSGLLPLRIIYILNREYRRMGVLDAVSTYCRRPMRVTGVALELSVPQAGWWRNSLQAIERPPATLYAHLDEAIGCPKSIVYLSDVSEENGPTSCYPGAYRALGLNALQELIGRVIAIVGSSPKSPLAGYYAKQYHQSVNSEGFRRHFMRLPESLRFNSHLGWDVVPGSALESALAAGEHRMIGPAGTCIIFDGGRLLHRGGLIQSGHRIALQVIFSDQTLRTKIVRRLKRAVT